LLKLITCLAFPDIMCLLLVCRLTEILCDSTPSDPKEKLLWLRKFRKGAVQTPEQLIDGLQLAATILDVRLCFILE